MSDQAASRGSRAAWDGGKCQVPMWSMGGPAGLCGEKAFGPQYPKAYLEAKNGYANPPYCFGPCCPSHGGPKEGEPILFMDGTDTDGRPMWCAVMPGFINLQESQAAYNRDPVAAVKNLLLATGVPALIPRTILSSRL